MFCIPSSHNLPQQHDMLAAAALASGPMGSFLQRDSVSGGSETIGRSKPNCHSLIGLTAPWSATFEANLTTPP